MKQADHFDTVLLVRALDDELSPAERSKVDAHLADCVECQARYHDLGVLSARLDSLVNSTSAGGMQPGRDVLEQTLLQRESFRKVRNSHTRNSHRWLGWGMAIAASLAAIVTVVPHLQKPATRVQTARVHVSLPSTFDIDGETFVALPYSDSEVPASESRIVQMQVPVSSLADAGVVFEPVSNETAAVDRSVLADVLVGADGEPMAVHVIENGE